MNIFLDNNICLDLLDSKRPTAKNSVQWYMKNKDDLNNNFYFSADGITTFYYVLTQKRKYDAKKTIMAIEALSLEIIPFYINHNDFTNARGDFFDEVFYDFEDLIILQSALRVKSSKFITNDKKLLDLKSFYSLSIESPNDLI